MPLTREIGKLFAENFIRFCCREKSSGVGKFFSRFRGTAASNKQKGRCGADAFKRRWRVSARFAIQARGTGDWEKETGNVEIGSEVGLGVAGRLLRYFVMRGEAGCRRGPAPGASFTECRNSDCSTAATAQIQRAVSRHSDFDTDFLFAELCLAGEARALAE